MANEEQFIKLKHSALYYVALSSIVLIMIVLLLALLKVERTVTQIICLSVIATVLLCSIIFLFRLDYLRQRQLIDYQNLMIENDKKRIHEKAQADLNQAYRLEALKLEKLHQIVKEISEKTTKKSVEEDGTKKEVISTLLNNTLIDNIKQLKIEIDKI